MSRRDTPSEFPSLIEQSRDVWNRIAEWWDDRIGDGNDFQDILLEPTSDRLLDLRPGEHVLDIACGAGRYARRMAAQGAHVVAFDHSESFIELARARTTDGADRIEYLVLNATDRDALLALGAARFDAAVCTMGLMDMASIEPLITTLPALLRPRGRFVFSVLHPAFNSGNACMVAEELRGEGRQAVVHSIKVYDYLTPAAYRGMGIEGQPEPQHYFHRPISTLFNRCFAAGFVLDGIEEPALPAGEDARALDWSRYQTIPPVLVARMRLAAM